MLFAILGYGRFGRAFADLLVQAGGSVRAYDPVASNEARRLYAHAPHAERLLTSIQKKGAAA